MINPKRLILKKILYYLIVFLFMTISQTFTIRCNNRQQFIILYIYMRIPVSVHNNII